MPGQPDQDGNHHLNMLAQAWDKTQARWDDDMSRRFDARYWTPMLNESRKYLSALQKLMELLAAAERDTEY